MTFSSNPFSSRACWEWPGEKAMHRIGPMIYMLHKHLSDPNAMHPTEK